MSESEKLAKFDERRIDIGELSLNVVEVGTGPLVVLLHGFPEFWGSWRRQLTALAAAGFRAVAPDMRGYHRSDKPRGVHAYHLDRLMGDVAALIRTLGEERAAAVVGHDWGGNVAWHFAMEYPQMLERLAILNMPHPLEMERGLRRPQQIKKSYYIFLYQLPRVPELLVRGGDFAVVRRMWQKDGVPPEDIDRLVEALRVADGVTGPINYYRSAFRSALTMRAKPVRQIDHPVLVIWGERDAYLGKEMAVPNPRWVPHARVEFLPEATHWVQAVSPERVNALLLEFLREGRPYRGRSAASMVG